MFPSLHHSFVKLTGFARVNHLTIILLSVVLYVFIACLIILMELKFFYTKIFYFDRIIVTFIVYLFHSIRRVYGGLKNFDIIIEKEIPISFINIRDVF